MHDQRSINQSERTSPLRVKFVVTSLPVGGAEMLLLNLVRRLNPKAICSEVVCLKEGGELESSFLESVPVHTHMLRSKWDISVLGRLKRLFVNTDAVITVGAGDKMFWGRLAAKLAKVPVVCSALHSTGWPDGIGRLNRLLTRLTDGFIAVAPSHRDFLIEQEDLPEEKVFVIPNGVDVERFRPDRSAAAWLREAIGISPDAEIVGIVAALREEKNHSQFLKAAKRICESRTNCHFVIVGNGPEHEAIVNGIQQLRLESKVHLLGSRSDTQRILARMDVFCLTSKNEANPVSILEALACEIPVVAPEVGSVPSTVIDGTTGLLTECGSERGTAVAITRLLDDTAIRRQYGQAGRQLVVQSWSLNAMVAGYQNTISQLFNAKAQANGQLLWRLKSDAELDSVSNNSVMVSAVAPLESETQGYSVDHHLVT